MYSNKTPGGHSFSEHSAQRANERGFSPQTIDNITITIEIVERVKLMIKVERLGST